MTSSPYARLLLSAVLFGTDPAARAHAAPGSLLAPSPTLPEAEIFPGQSHVAPDGSVYVRGSFTSVDGFPRPGLVRLQPDGQVDPNFQPAVVDVTASSADFAPLPENQQAAAAFLPLSDGTLLYAGPQRMSALAPDGRWDSRFDFLHEPGRPLQPLFEQEGRIYFLRVTPAGRRLEAVRADTFAPVPLDAQDTWPNPLLQAVPAEAGKLWILVGKFLSFPDPWLLQNNPRTLLRVLPDGSLDPTFPPVVLAVPRSYSLRQRPNGGFFLVSTDPNLVQYWPTPTTLAARIEWYSPAGVKERETTLYLTPRAEVLFHAGLDGSVVYASYFIPQNLTGTFQPSELGPAGALFRMRPDGTGDPGFLVPLEEFALQALPSGGLLHSHTRRLLADGSPDPEWHVPLFTTDPVLELVAHVADGHILAAFSEREYPWQRPGKQPLILTPDFQPDPVFHPPTSLPPISTILPGADQNSVLLVLGTAHSFEDGSKTRLLRLRRDGSVDPDSPRFLPTQNLFSTGPDGGVVAEPFDGSFTVHPLANGKFIVQYVLPGADVAEWIIRRLRADGSVDPTFVFNEVSWTHSELRVLADGSLFGGGAFYDRDGSHRETIPRLMNSGLAAEWPDGSLLMSNWTESGDGVEYLRWIPGAGRDPDFACPLRPDSRVRRFLPLPDGGLILAGHLILPNGTNSLVKFYPDGRPDPAFRPPPAYRILPRPPGLQFLINGEDIFPAFAGHRARPADISSLRLQPGGGAVLVGGNFTHLGFSPRRGLALLSLETPRDYQEWMASTLGDTSFSPFEDEDHDGRTNLEEYATGSDPGRPDLSPTVRLSASAPPIFQIPLNPQALGVRMIPQISNDLTGWTDAEDTQFAATSLPHLLRLQSTASPSQLFLRLRFEQETAPR